MSVQHRFTREPATVARDVKCAQLRAQGWTYSAIAAAVGLSDKGNAYRAVQRVLADVQTEAADELRKVEGLRLTTALTRAFEILNGDHPVVSNGVKFDDLQDARVALGAIREIRQLSESVRRLYGLDAPTRAEVRVTDDLTAEIESLAAELAAADRRAASRSEEATPGPAAS